MYLLLAPRVEWTSPPQRPSTNLLVRDSFTHITSSFNLIRVVHLHLYPPIRCDCTLELFTRNIPRVNLAKSCIRASRGGSHSRLFTCWMEDYLSLRDIEEYSKTSTKRYLHPPKKLLEDNVFSYVCLSFSLSVHRQPHTSLNNET